MPQTLTFHAPMARRLAIALAINFAWGMATSPLQGLLPSAISPFANSASGWSLVCGLTLAWAALPLGASAVAGALGFTLLVVGYSVASHLNGLYYNPIPWTVVGLVAGPCLGAAVSLLHSSQLGRAAGAGFLASIGIGDGLHGYATVRDTTGSTYWILAIVVGVALLGFLAFTRIESATHRFLAVGFAAALSAAFAGMMNVLSSGSFGL